MMPWPTSLGTRFIKLEDRRATVIALGFVLGAAVVALCGQRQVAKARLPDLGPESVIGKLRLGPGPDDLRQIEICCPLYILIEFVRSLVAETLPTRDLSDEIQEFWRDVSIPAEARNRLRELARSTGVSHRSGHLFGNCGWGLFP
jgi:hypothetical protein